MKRHPIETLNFKEFLANDSIKKERHQERPNNITAYSIYMNPLALFDPTFLLIGAGVVLVAVIEKQLANNDMVFIASAVSGILRIAFPITAAGALLYLLSHSASFLL